MKQTSLLALAATLLLGVFAMTGCKSGECCSTAAHDHATACKACCKEDCGKCCKDAAACANCCKDKK